MTDNIIKAAKAAGGTTYTNRHHSGTACAFGPEALSRFYAIAFAQGMERAAVECDEMSLLCARTAPGAFDGRYDFMAEAAKDCADAIRAQMKQDAAIARATHKEQT